jgi:hypothetical protein
MLESRVVPSNIDYSMGFADHSALTANGFASFPGSVVRLTDGGLMEAGSTFTNSTVDVTQFNTTFTFVLSMGSTIPIADGITFTIQASQRGPTALGVNGSGLGYENIPYSVAIKFKLFNVTGEGLNSTGIFSDGRIPTVRQPGLGSEFPDESISLDGTGIDLHSQDPMRVTLAYDGSTLTENIQDTVRGAKFTQSYSVNIPSIIGSNTAFVGFTGATSGLAAVQDIQTWTGTFGPQTGSNLTISSLSPNSAQAGSSSFTLIVNGTNFVPGATVQWTANGTTTALRTTLVSINGSQQLLANVDTSLLTTSGSASVSVIQVVNGSALTSNSLTFTITPTSATLPFISSLSPSSAQAGSSSFSLTVNGTDFVPGATMQWTANGTTTPLPTTLVSINGSQQLLANVDSSLLTTAATASVSVTQVVNGSSLTSNSLTFTISPASTTGPFITSLSPGFAQAGSSSFTLIVDGTNFVPGATVQWTANGTTTALRTTLVSINGSQQLLTHVDSSLLTTPGTTSVSVAQVVNGSLLTSNSLIFIIPPTLTTGLFISSLSSSSAQEGSGRFTFTVNGFGFGSGSTVQWTQNGTTTPLPTILVSSIQLLAVVPASLVAEESISEHGGPISVSVSNGLGSTSNAVAFTVREAPMSLTAAGATINAPALQTIAPTLATFIDTGGPEPVSDCSAAINWGDASVTTGTITANSDGSFRVSGTHAYKAGGTYSIVVTISHESAPQITATVTANISGGGGGGDAAFVGQNPLLGAIGVQTVAVGTPLTVSSKSAPQLPIQSSAAAQSGEPSSARDLYWQLVGRGEQVTGSPDWVPDTRAWNVEGISSKDSRLCVGSA